VCWQHILHPKKTVVVFSALIRKIIVILGQCLWCFHRVTAIASGHMVLLLNAKQLKSSHKFDELQKFWPETSFTVVFRFGQKGAINYYKPAINVKKIWLGVLSTGGVLLL